MKFVLPFLFSGCTLFAAPASLNGQWKVHNSISGNESDMNCTFSQTDAAIQGTCNGERGPAKVTGKLDGQQVTWQFKIDYQGDTLTLVYNGKIDADGKIAGSIDVQPMAVSGDFSAVPVK